jgi:hypothetical protein
MVFSVADDLAGDRRNLQDCQENALKIKPESEEAKPEGLSID